MTPFKKWQEAGYLMCSECREFQCI